MKKIFLVACIVLFSVACNDSNSLRNDGKSSFLNSERYNSSSSQIELAKAKRTSSLKPIPNNNSQIQRKLIKKGNLNFETDNLNKTKATIQNLVSAAKGYISKDNEFKSHDRISNTISLRIPASKFDNIVVELSKGIEKFDSKSITISDVTEQFLDVEARLKTKKALELKYLEILKKAKSVREILDVERELGKLRGDIEATEGRLKYLQNQISFSSLHITFYKKLSASKTSFVGKIIDAFKGGFESVKAFFLFLINIWPFIIILFLVFFYFRKRVFRTKS